MVGSQWNASPLVLFIEAENFAQLFVLEKCLRLKHHCDIKLNLGIPEMKLLRNYVIRP
jgi:hypothetical protein